MPMLTELAVPFRLCASSSMVTVCFLTILLLQ
jgi:hypothetical protein